MCAPTPPPAPDYLGAAEQQGQANLAATRAGSKLNNPNVVSPYGRQTVTYGSGFDQAGFDSATRNYKAELDRYEQMKRYPWFGAYGYKPPTAPDRNKFILGDPDVPTITQTFSPEQQVLYDQSNTVKQLLGGLGIQGAESLQGVVGKPVDFSGLPPMPGNAEGTRQKVIDAMMARVNEDTDVARGQANSDLVAAGIRPGSDAYDTSFRQIDRAYNDARNQAFLASGQAASQDFAMDSERRRQAITEMLSQRQIPLNEITALMSGSQVSNPFSTPGFGGVASPQASPVFAAQNALSGYNTDVFNSQAAGAANQQSGLMGLGSAAIMAGVMF